MRTRSVSSPSNSILTLFLPLLDLAELQFCPNLPSKAVFSLLPTNCTANEGRFQTETLKLPVFWFMAEHAARFQKSPGPNPDAYAALPRDFSLDQLQLSHSIVTHFRKQQSFPKDIANRRLFLRHRQLQSNFASVLFTFYSRRNKIKILSFLHASKATTKAEGVANTPPPVLYILDHDPSPIF